MIVERNSRLQFFTNSKGELKYSNLPLSSKKKPKKSSAKKNSISERLLRSPSEFVVIRDNKNLLNGNSFQVRLKYYSEKYNETRYYELKILKNGKSPKRFILQTIKSSSVGTQQTFCKIYNNFQDCLNEFKKRRDNKLRRTYQEDNSNSNDINLSQEPIPVTSQFSSEDLDGSEAHAAHIQRSAKKTDEEHESSKGNNNNLNTEEQGEKSLKGFDITSEVIYPGLVVAAMALIVYIQLKQHKLV